MGNENQKDSNGYGKIYIKINKPIYYPGEEITGKYAYTKFSQELCMF